MRWSVPPEHRSCASIQSRRWRRVCCARSLNSTLARPTTRSNSPPRRTIDAMRLSRARWCGTIKSSHYKIVTVSQKVRPQAGPVTRNAFLCRAHAGQEGVDLAGECLGRLEESGGGVQDGAAAAAGLIGGRADATDVGGDILGRLRRLRDVA